MSIKISNVVYFDPLFRNIPVQRDRLFFFFPAMCEIKNWSPLSTHPGRADEVGEGMLPHGVPPGGTEHSRAPFAA